MAKPLLDLWLDPHRYVGQDAGKTAEVAVAMLDAEVELGHGRFGGLMVVCVDKQDTLGWGGIVSVGGSQYFEV